VTRYTVRPARPAGSVFWSVAAVVGVIAGLAAISHDVAVAVVIAAILGWTLRACARAARSGR
jgi:hypothetical protein